MARVQHGPTSSFSEEHSDVSEHLNKLRERLLDLTARNRLLSFAHSAASCLRVVDELPDQLFGRLIDEEALHFSSIPEPTERELRQFHTDGSRVPRAETESDKLTPPKAEVWAKFKGYSTDYELPVEVDEGEREKKHDDAFVQTLLYPPDLDRRLRKLRGDARTAIEESGVNMLYLSFGFLEWRDEKSVQEKSFLAPLLLVPLELQRTLRGRQVDYALSWTGEEIQLNLSLAKKLDRDFGLVLPDVEENETPDSYFTKVRTAVLQKPNWRVRRYVTLSLFNFGKLLLYLDLDPSRWPVNGQITSHDLVRKVLGANNEGGSGIGLSEEPIDHQYLDTELALVDRADSSQAEALKYALSGKSLVVQGPPGTGKSQTITNLIAAALSENKSVLFVSEKLAALEVVRRRLRELGLGEFCLELHSNKTRKLTLVKDLETRVALDRKLPTANKIKQARDEQKQIRNRIEKYVDLLRLPLGQMDLPLSKVLFEAGKARLDLGDLSKTIAAPKSFDSNAITPTDRAVANRYFNELHDTVTSAGGADAMKRHPWQGVSASKLLALDAHEAALLAREWANSALNLKQGLEALGRFTSLELDSSLSFAERLIGLSDRLQKAQRFCQHLRMAEWFCEQIENYLGAQLPKGGERYSLSKKLVELSTSFPAQHEHLRGPWLYDERFDTTVTRIEKICETLRRAHQAASQSIDVKRKPKHSSAELRAAAEALRSTSLLRSLSPAWRRAKSVWDMYCLPNNKVDPNNLEAFATFVDTVEVLASDVEASNVLSKAYQGARTDIQGLHEIKHWIDEVAKSVRNSTIAGKLVTADSTTIATLARGASHDAFASLEICADLSVTVMDGETASPDMWANYLSANFEPPLFEFLTSCSIDFDWANFAKRAELLESSLQAYVAAYEKFANRTGLDVDSWFYGSPSDLLDDIVQRANSAASNEDQLKNWLRIQVLLDAAPHAACAEMARSALQGRYAVDGLKQIYGHFLYDGLARRCFEQYPDLRVLRGSTMDSLRDAFRSADEALMEIRRIDIAQRLASRTIPQGKFSQRVSDLTEMNLIKNELSKQKRHIPIRKLVERAGRALQGLKPCFMMGPMSVAQYLQPGSLTFDLIIMDEASQLRPEDAVGALARGRQAIIVGDPKQLPPTSFFDTQIGAIDGGQTDEGAFIAQMSESILDLSQITLDMRMLRWHYRSRHPSLIQFSNKEFYDGELVVFPSPVEENERYGISYEYVEIGLFVNHVNQNEARRVAAAAVTHLRNHPARSLGVVAMNINQKELIEAEIDRLLRDDPLVLQTAEDSETKSEPFFVKNLENVQGDERDVIMISMTYGREVDGGRVLQRFGPINHDVGWRRLNVLFTRAKERMHVVSSMRAEEILLGDTPSRGTQALKAFLNFVERGRDIRVHESNRTPGSDFEHAVLEGIQGLGFDCVPQLGVAGFFLDIAVRDPDQREEFVLGIECDGMTYHSSRSVRDRDRLRQDILEDLGWEIERIWSVDWFQDPAGELNRVEKRVEDLISERRSKRSRKSIVTDLLQTGESKPTTPIHPSAGEPIVMPEVTQPASVSGKSYQKLRQESLSFPQPGVLDLLQNSRRSQKTGTLSVQDARDLLIELREAEIEPKYADADPAKGLLRKTMLDYLLKHKPVSVDEFQSKLPQNLRSETDGRQLKEFGERVFGILEKVE